MKGTYSATVCVVVEGASFAEDVSVTMDDDDFAMLPETLTAVLGDEGTCGLVGTSAST
mgnify:CR=1 FL=1